MLCVAKRIACNVVTLLLGEFAATCVAACDMKASLLCFHSNFLLHVSCSRLKPQASFCIVIRKTIGKTMAKRFNPGVVAKSGAPSHPQAPCFEEDQRVPTGDICPAWASLTTLWSTHGPCQVEEEHYWTADSLQQKDRTHARAGRPPPQMV